MSNHQDNTAHCPLVRTPTKACNLKLWDKQEAFLKLQSHIGDWRASAIVRQNDSSHISKVVKEHCDSDYNKAASVRLIVGKMTWCSHDNCSNVSLIMKQGPSTSRNDKPILMELEAITKFQILTKCQSGQMNAVMQLLVMIELEIPQANSMIKTQGNR